MSSFGVVLDACVLVAAPLRDSLLRAAEKGLYRPHWSHDILSEVQHVLVRERLTTEAQAASLIETLEDVFEEAKVHGYHDLIPAMRNQQDDRHVLAAAVCAGAQAIITNNIRHFPEESIAPHAIEVLTPDEYLLDLYDLNPGVMRRILHEQGADLNPPWSAVEVCEKLRIHAPNFVDRILNDFESNTSDTDLGR
jgi:predicted nucleic acid-binding protein